MVCYQFLYLFLAHLIVPYYKTSYLCSCFIYFFLLLLLWYYRFIYYMYQRMYVRKVYENTFNTMIGIGKLGLLFIKLLLVVLVIVIL